MRYRKQIKIVEGNVNIWAFTAVCHSSSERKACTRSILVGMPNVKTLGCVGDAEAMAREDATYRVPISMVELGCSEYFVARWCSKDMMFGTGWT